MAPVLERDRQRAERTLEREYSKLRRTTINGVRSRLALRYVTPGRQFDDLDLEAFYNQAWHGLYMRLAAGQEIENHAGFLVHAAYYRAVDEIRRSQPARVDPVAVEELGVEPDIDAMLDDHAKLTHFMEGMRERLTDRERKAATLCYIQGYTRPQTAEIIGVSPKRMEKLMDGVSQKIGALVEDIRGGGWCESRSSLMKAYAFGVLDPDGERWDLAVAHLRDCPGCRRYVRSLRGIGAVAPPIGIPLAAMAALGGASAAGAAGASAGAGGSSAGAAGSSAGAAGSSAGAGAGSTATAGAGFGGIGATAIAASAAVVVAAAGVGGVAVTRSGDKTTPPPPPAPVVRTVASTPAVAPAKSTPKKTATKKKVKKKARKKKSASNVKPATTTPATTTPQPTTTATVPTQTTQQAAQQTAPRRPAPSTGDASQEFGFEK